GRIDYERYNKEFNIDKFWAQAYHIYKCVPDFNSSLSSEDVKVNEARNEKFMVLSAECDAVSRFYEFSEDMQDFRTASDVISELSLTGFKLNTIKVGSALKKYG